MVVDSLSALSDSGVNLFTCDEKHMPCGTLLPMNSHCRQLKVLKKQIEISKPVEKQIWKEIVVRKIENQAQCLALSHRPGADVLRNMAKAVTPGVAGVTDFFYKAVQMDHFMHECRHHIFNRS